MEQSKVNKRLLRHNFANAKAQCLGKRDKSSAGRIDPHAVDICAVLNAKDEFYTTSSCAGRCFLYQGQGIKSTEQFRRYRVSHDCVANAQRYFDLSTLSSDPSGGGDPIPSIGQFEHAEKVKALSIQDKKEVDERTIITEESSNNTLPNPISETTKEASNNNAVSLQDDSIWLRFEPFILHVACRSLAAAAVLMAAARPSFKNVGLTTWKEEGRYLVAIWGDEGLEMPLSTPDGTPLFNSTHTTWLQTMVNERHTRNWNKIDRFVQAVRDMPDLVDDLDQDDEYDILDSPNKGLPRIPRSFDVVGDIAVLHSISTTDPTERAQIGQAILQENKAIKLVVVRESTMVGTERAPGQYGFSTIAGTPRSPLLTTHNEFGIKCVVDLQQTFFSPRMGQERLRICQQVARGEHVLVLFCGVGMDALQIAGRTEASSILAIELNEAAVKCAHLSHRMLERNKAIKCVEAAQRLEIRQGDVLQVVPTLPRNYFDRIVAPRPKEGGADGDLGDGEGGMKFLKCFLPVLKKDSGECHWYDFVADHEFPECERSRALLSKCCANEGLNMQVIHVANAGSVAMRQLRVCIDFRVSPFS
jgi:tRNA G37 N-methylase Trm5